jgi:hypothetical protein
MFLKNLTLLSLTALAFLSPFAAATDESVDCDHPSDENINLSYTAGGGTIYYNNHCSEDMDVYYYDLRNLKFKAFTAGAGDKSHGDTGGNSIYGVTAEPA